MHKRISLPYCFTAPSGVTLIELLVVMAVAGLLLGLTMVTLLPFQDRTVMNTTLDTLLMDIKQQQIKAMVGDTDGGGAREPYSVYFQEHSYTVYPGTVYSVNNKKNFTVAVDEPLVLEADLPDKTLIFANGSGELANFDAARHTVVIRFSPTGEEKTVTFNKYGTITAVN